MNVQSVVDELNEKLPIVLNTLEAQYSFVEKDDPRLDRQLILRWSENMSIEDGLIMVVSEIKAHGFLLTPFTLIGENLIHAMISTKPHGSLPGASI